MTDTTRHRTPFLIVEPTNLPMTDSRYPYTYAADFIRSYGPVSDEGVVLSRSDASEIREAIAKALGINDEELAKKLADAELANNQDSEYGKRQTLRLLKAMRFITQENSNV